jgi:Flp pilus assembly protein TadG
MGGNQGLGMTFWGKRSNNDEGASLVEFALLMPLLILLVLGVVEFGFKFGQFNELRHAVREGARYAAVSSPDYDGGGGTGDANDVIAVVCDAIDLPNSTLSISLSGGTDRLDHASLEVAAAVESLTGVPLISSFLPDALTNEATFRLEQDAGWSTFSNQPCP